MIDLFYALLGVAAILFAGCLCVICGVALLALIDGFKKVVKKRKEDDHET